MNPLSIKISLTKSHIHSWFTNLVERACKCFNVFCSLNSFLAFLRHFCQTGCEQGWILWHLSRLSQRGLVMVTNSLSGLDCLKSDEVCTQAKFCFSLHKCCPLQYTEDFFQSRKYLVYFNVSLIILKWSKFCWKKLHD